MTRRTLTCALLVASAAAAPGCVGARAYVKADDARYPVSMSSVVRDPDGRLLGGDDLEVKGRLEIGYMTCRMLWTLIPLKPIFGPQDISDDINEQVAARGGEAVVNLTVQSAATVWNVMTLVGVLPDCGKVKIEGDIVSRKAGGPPPVATAAP